MAVDDGDSLDLDFSGPDAEKSVIDDAKYSHKRRLRAIHNAHDRAIDVRNTVEEHLIQRQISEFDARRYYRGAVESYIMEVMPVLKSDELDLNEYVEDVELGSVTLTPPAELVEFASENIDRLPPGCPVPQPYSRPITGLQTVLDLPSPIGKQFTVVLNTGEQRSDTVRTELSRKLLDTALQTTTQALEEADMGLNIGEGKPHRSMGIDGKWPWEADGIEMPHVQLRKQNGEATADD